MALIDTMLQKQHSSYQKYRLTKMAPSINAPYKNGTSQKRHLTKTASQNFYIGFLKYCQHPANKTYP